MANMANTNELDYYRKVADGERLEIIMRQVASRFKLDGNVLAEALQLWTDAWDAAT